MKKFRLRIPTQLYILLTFALVILFGTICFVLPFSTLDGKGLSFINALFTSTSATCVTGLSTINCSELSLFGKIILAVLIELGGLSFLTIATFIYSMFSKMSIGSFKLMTEALNYDRPGEVVKMIRKVLLIAAVIQLIGFSFNTIIFHFEYGMSVPQALGYGAFHAISSFNNAGFDIFGTNSLIDFSSDWFININTMLLIILGGIGFLVIDEVLRKRRWRKFSLNTKVVLITTISLLVLGTLLFKLTMFKEMSWLQALFQSTSARTAGFATYDMTKLNTTGYIIMISLMFIGASPASTGGGLKTTTLFVLILVMIRFVRGEKYSVFKRKIPTQLVHKAFVIFVIEIVYVLIATFLMAIFEPNISFDRLLFEVVSAFATVGLSMGITGELSLGGQIIIIVTMYIGRLGPLTILSLSNNKKNIIKDKQISYIEEKIIIG